MEKQKILLITGREAASAVRKYSRLVDAPTQIHVCNIDVAACLSPKTLLDELSSLDLKGISHIIVPGALRGDLSMIRERTGVSCFKGPKNISDLPTVLDAVSRGVILSEKLPADEILQRELKRNIEKELQEAYNRPQDYTLKIGDKKPVYLGTGIMRVIAEIPDAPSLSDREIKRISSYYVNSGAGIIDIGMTSGEDNSNEIRRLVDSVKSVTGVPVAIDSLNREEISTALESGVDLILSLDLTNYRIIESANVPAAVIIPRDYDGIPRGVDERINLMEKLIQKLQDQNFNKFIVDMVLDPPNLGLISSLQAFHEFRWEYPQTPMMIGSGNVTELIDADSVGVNALTAAIASELDIDLLFTTEASRKTRGTVKELSRAAEMMYLSKKKEQPPKDLGIDLLWLKDKREIEVIRDPREKNLEEIKVREERALNLENTEFRIYLSDEIEALYYKDRKPELKFRGGNAKTLYKEIIHRKLVTNPEHAAYLGKELMKAEIALKLGKNYIQDEDLF